MVPGHSCYVGIYMGLGGAKKWGGGGSLSHHVGGNP